MISTSLRRRLSKHFPATGPCLICCDPTYRQNHRLIDAMRGRFRAGEKVQELAADYEMPVAVVRAVVTLPVRSLAFLRRNFAETLVKCRTCGAGPMTKEEYRDHDWQHYDSGEAEREGRVQRQPVP